jgi:SPP1 gp7 family putative phage head morphogenesis protein
VADVQGGFGVRFQEAIDNLQGKLPEASLRWDSLAGPVHGKVFTVAGATSAALASDLQQALVSALANGTTITQFRRDFDATVQRYGWTYNGKRGWRTQLIFSTNMRSASMAGRWAQITANADRRPYLQYRTAGDARVRPAHRQWDGRIYPVGDAFWSTHYPPNGWGCRCTVRAYSQAEVDRKGLQVSEPIPGGTRAVTNRAGELVDVVPKGIDSGWDHNVGRSWLTPELSLGEKLASLPRELRGAVVDKTISPAYQAAMTANWKAFQTAIEGGSKGPQDAQIVGFLDSAVLDAADALPALQLQTSAVAVLGDSLPRVAGASGAWPAAWVAQLPIELRDYSAVLWDRTDQVLVMVTGGEIPGEATRYGTARIRPGVRTNFGPALSLEALGDASAAELRGARYQVLVGQVGGGAP